MEFLSVGCSVLQAFYKWRQNAEVRHRKDLLDVKNAHDSNMLVYEELKPSNCSPLQLYSTLAADAGIFDGLPDVAIGPADVPLLIADATHLHTVPGSDILVQLQAEICVSNQSSIVLRVTCVQDATIVNCIAPMEQGVLDIKHLSKNVTLLIEGYKPDYSAVQYTLCLDRSQQSSVVVSESNGSFEVACQPRTA